MVRLLLNIIPTWIVQVLQASNLQNLCFVLTQHLRLNTSFWMTFCAGAETCFSYGVREL